MTRHLADDPLDHGETVQLVILVIRDTGSSIIEKGLRQKPDFSVNSMKSPPWRPRDVRTNGRRR